MSAPQTQINLALICKRSKHFGEFCQRAEQATANPAKYLKDEAINQLVLSNIKGRLAPRGDC